ncbi:MAG: histidine kinase [Dehalococcoidia bacterium]
MLYVTIGLVTLLSAFVFFAQRTISQHTGLMLQERLAFTRTVAADVDLVIDHVQAELVRNITLLDPGLADGISRQEANVLGSIQGHLAGFHRLQLPREPILLDIEGRVIWSAGEAPHAWAGPDPDPFLVHVLATGTAGVYAGEDNTDRGRPMISVAAPVIDGDGAVRGVLAVAVMPTSDSAGFAPFSRQGNVGYHLELVTSRGIAAISSDPEDTFKTSRHLSVIGGLIESREPGVDRHLRSREQTGMADHIVAFVPLSSVPWGVVLEQPEDVALALPRTLQGQLLLLSGLGLVGGLALAWLTTRQVVRPLLRLTATSREIARGDLGTPIATGGPDEVGELALSFETMRSRLKESLEKLEGWSRELEDRVKDRTLKLEERDRERTILLQKLIQAQEEERKRVARELHDEVGQALTGLVMNLGSVDQVLMKDPAKAKERLKVVMALSSKTVDDVRRLIGDLRPSVLDDMGLIPALRWYADDYLGKAGIKATVTANGFSDRIPPHIEVAIFRVVQEAITNIVRHARAGTAEISLQIEGDTIRGLVRDDGTGFDLAPGRPGASGRTSVGLLGMEERISLLGGSFRIESQPGEGTSVIFEVPSRWEEDHGHDQGTDN